MSRWTARLVGSRISRFAAIGAFGAVCNLAIMTALIMVSTDYLVAALIASEITIIGNFILQERLVFADLPGPRRSRFQRFVFSFGFNNLEAGVRVPVLWILVEMAHLGSVLGQAVTLMAAFVLRYGFHLKFVYAEQQTVPVPVSVSVAMLPRELPDGTA